MPVKAVDVQGGKVMIHTIADVLVPPSLVPKAKKGDDKAENKGEKKEEKATAGAAGVTASVLLALPLVAAALL